jgi:hypothetical protein
MTRLEDLGRRIARVQDEDREDLASLDRAGESFIRALRQPVRRPRRGLLAVAMAAAAVVAVVGWWLLPAPGSSGLQKNQCVEAPLDRTIPLDFADGSRVLLAPGTRAVVAEIHDRGASLDLERGQAEVSVRHQPETRWMLRAGPYRVRVTGTRFDLRWSPEQDRFEIGLAEGSVVVTTDLSSHAAVKMVAPERLVIDHGRWQLSPARSEPRPAATGPAPAPAAASVASTTVTAAAAPPGWQELGRAGDYRRAYDQVRSIGVGQLADTESAASLLTLAEVCRFAGHGGEAVTVLTKLRQRFAGSDAAAVAAFQLGRAAGSGAEGARWFGTYLRERPGGSLAREASGRLLEALDRSGDHAAAVRAAQSYLARYPAGPHSAFARQILDQ